MDLLQTHWIHIYRQYSKYGGNGLNSNIQHNSWNIEISYCNMLLLYFVILLNTDSNGFSTFVRLNSLNTKFQINQNTCQMSIGILWYTQCKQALNIKRYTRWNRINYNFHILIFCTLVNLRITNLYICIVILLLFFVRLVFGEGSFACISCNNIMIKNRTNFIISSNRSIPK